MLIGCYVRMRCLNADAEKTAKIVRGYFILPHPVHPMYTYVNTTCIRTYTPRVYICITSCIRIFGLVPNPWWRAFTTGPCDPEKLGLLSQCVLASPQSASDKLLKEIRCQLKTTSVKWHLVHRHYERNQMQLTAVSTASYSRTAVGKLCSQF